MTWQPYDLDRIAQDLVLAYRDEDVLKESHKMRTTIAYGLERFWGEHLRLMKSDPAKGRYWYSVWQAFAKLMNEYEILIPKGKIWEELLPLIKGDAKLKIPNNSDLEKFCDSLTNQGGIKIAEEKTWKQFRKLIEKEGIQYPDNMKDIKKRQHFQKDTLDQVEILKTNAIRNIAQSFWDSAILSREDQRIALSILTQLCDSLVWWTQRYSKKTTKNNNEDNQDDN